MTCSSEPARSAGCIGKRRDPSESKFYPPSAVNGWVSRRPLSSWMPSGISTVAWPLKPRGPGAPGRPPRPSVGDSGASGAIRKPPGATTNQTTKAMSQPEAIEILASLSAVNGWVSRRPLPSWMPSRASAAARPLKGGPCLRYGFLGFLARAPGAPGLPGGPPRPSVGVSGDSGALRRPPGATTNQTTKTTSH